MLGSAVLVFHALGMSGGTLGSLLLSPGLQALSGSSALSPPAHVLLMLQHSLAATLVLHAFSTLSGTSLSPLGTLLSDGSPSRSLLGSSGGCAFLGGAALSIGFSTGGTRFQGSSAFRLLHASCSPGGTFLSIGGPTGLSCQETFFALGFLHASSSAGRSSLEVFSMSGGSALLVCAAFLIGLDSLHSSLLSGLTAFFVLGASSPGGNSGLVLQVSGPAFRLLFALLEPRGTSLLSTASAAASSSVFAEVMALLLFAFAFLGLALVSEVLEGLADLFPVIGPDMLQEHSLDGFEHLLGSLRASLLILALLALGFESFHSGCSEALSSGSSKTVGTLLSDDTLFPAQLPFLKSILSTVVGGLLDPLGKFLVRGGFLALLLDLRSFLRGGFLARLLELSNVEFGSIDCDAGSQDGKGEGSHIS